MKFRLFEEVVLAVEAPAAGLRKGDIATIVEHHPVTDDEDGYSLEVFNALGETVAVITLPESALEPLTANEVLTVRLLNES